MNLAIVTSVWGDYGAYLQDWAASITNQTVLPRQAVIMDGGCFDRAAPIEASQVLVAAGVDATVVRGRRSPMGVARNSAVAPTTTEWVMHLDADDVLLHDCLENVRRYTDGADVVSIGALRGGRAVTFPKVSREYILAGNHGCFSCAPFRRELWRQRPWHTRNDWIDSVFWVGLAHLGATFVGTSEPGFIYRDHQDSFSRRLPKLDRLHAQTQWRRACREWSLS